MKRLVVAFVVSGLSQVLSGLALADLPDASWKALGERAIVIVKQDGGEVSGKLMAVDGASVTLVTGAGQVLSVSRSDVGSVRVQPTGVGPVPLTLPPAAPLYLPPATGPLPPLALDPVTPLSPAAVAAPVQPGRTPSFGELGGLVNALETADSTQLVAFLDLDPRARSLSVEQQQQLSEEFSLSSGRRAAGILLSLVPGLGNFVQGDYWWGTALLSAGVAGLLLFATGHTTYVDRSGGGSPDYFEHTTAGYTVGLGLLGAAALTGLIRAIVFEPAKGAILRDYFRRKAQASNGLELRPFAALQPSIGAGATMTQLYQFGLQGRF